MDIHFEAALKLIDLGSYEKAVKNLEIAIKTETDNGHMETATEYTCVLGELLANMGENDKAAAEFRKVLSYCTMTNSLPKQLKIAREFIFVYENQANGKGNRSASSKKASSTSQSAKFMQ